MTSKQIERIVAQLKKASHAEFNLGEPIMTDVEYDELLEELRRLDPKHPQLFQTGAPLENGDRVKLPYPLPSCQKTATVPLIRFLKGEKQLVLTAKYDGVSAMWLPEKKKLYTRGDGLVGRDISHLISSIRDLVKVEYVVRGEIMLKKNSKLIPKGKIGRNIVTGLLSRDTITRDHKELQFIAYEIIDPSDIKPSESLEILQRDGFETAVCEVLESSVVDEKYLQTEMDSLTSDNFDYDIDGIVIQVNKARSSTFTHEIREVGVVCPADTLAWKPMSKGLVTKVTDVKWNPSADGLAKPVVIFEPIRIDGAVITQATGHNAKNIVLNGIGVGAVIEVNRAGRTIPSIVRIVKRAEPALPEGLFASGEGGGGEETDDADEVTLEWVGPDIKFLEETTAVRKSAIKKAFEILGVENVGPWAISLIFDKFCANGDPKSDLNVFYKLTKSQLKTLPGVAQKKATQIYDGLRVNGPNWTEIDFMAASGVFPRGFGKSKLKLIENVIPDFEKWTEKNLLKNRPSGVSNETLKLIAQTMPVYELWIKANPIFAEFVQSISVSPEEEEVHTPIAEENVTRRHADSKPNNGETTSHKGKTQLAKLLPNLEARDWLGETALIKASYEGETQDVKLLLDAGANPNIGNNFGETALMRASVKGHVEIIKLLLDAGAEVNARENRFRNTALMSVSFEGQVKAAKLLLDAGANPNLSNKGNNTALMLAARYGRVEIVKLLLAAGAEVNARENYDVTPLMLASKYGSSEIVKLLLDAGADPKMSMIYGYTALTEASNGAHQSVINLLKAAGATK